MENTNPLLKPHGLPRFSHIHPEHVVPAIEQIIEDSRQQVAQLLAANGHYTWENLVVPIEDLDEVLNQAWSPVSHMNSVVNSAELREAYNACLPKLSDYATEMGQHSGLYQAFKQIADGAEYPQLNSAQRKVIDNALRDFRLTGIELDDDDKVRYREIMLELSSLTAKFEENILDATNAWSKSIDSQEKLQGLSDTALAMARQAAGQKDLAGFLLTLEFPSYFAIITYADDRELRRELYTAYVTRASDEGPTAGQFDNGPIMETLLARRHELANLLGFDNYAQRSLATKMALDTEQVMSFLQDLATRSLPMAKEELQELRQFAVDTDSIEELQAWDVPYYSEKLRQHKYSITQEELKPYFPEQKVVEGMFDVVRRLYGLQINEITTIETWHKDVRFFEILDKDSRLRGQFYLDLYARPHKRGGAWMDECIGRNNSISGLTIPVAYLTCNLSPPVGDGPALFTHDEVVTLFHEFGHGLHHMLTLIDYPSVSGISGVAWDAVELPSQFMENWCWEREALDVIASHYQTGAAIPDEMFRRMLAAKNFQSGMQMVRQLEFAIFDFRLHKDYDPEKHTRVYDVLDEVRRQVAVIHPPAFNRFLHSFSHIFAGGYSAGYYSYKWAEVLSADAFAQFEENGIFDRRTGLHFMQSILEQGGSQEPMELFVNFRGREPSIDALLRHSGIAA
ncbi:MAG: oligopeptidase A [Gammaproteobacteria bacterium]|nr:MAG: oligopeptidase A [Gammaproteobacteria bacterium]